MLPQRVYEALKAFIEAKKTGSFTIHIKEGKVMNFVVTEHNRVSDP